MKKLFVFLLLLAGVSFLFWFHETRWPVRSAQDPPSR